MDFPNIDPVAFSIGPLLIRWYALAYLAGLLGGWIVASRLAYAEGRGRPTRLDIDDFLVWAIPGVILGGRMGYVLFYNLPYYLEHPIEALMLWHGGMSFHGGVLGVIVALLCFSILRKIPLLHLSDIVCCVVPIGLFFGRMANFINGELFGRITDSPWGMIFPAGGDDPRHPSQIYEAFSEGLLLFVILIILARLGVHRKMPGVLSGVFLLGYGIARFLIEYVREPDPQLGLFFDFISMGQILCLPMILIGLFLIFYGVKTKHVIPEKSH